MVSPMATTPLYTLAEINAEIDRWKACYSALAAGKTYTMASSGSSQSYTPQDVDVVWKQLERLQSIRMGIESGAGGMQVLVGRPQR